MSELEYREVKETAPRLPADFAEVRSVPRLLEIRCHRLFLHIALLRPGSSGLLFGFKLKAAVKFVAGL